MKHDQYITIYHYLPTSMYLFVYLFMRMYSTFMYDLIEPKGATISHLALFRNMIDYSRFKFFPLPLTFKKNNLAHETFFIGWLMISTILGDELFGGGEVMIDVLIDKTRAQGTWLTDLSACVRVFSKFACMFSSVCVCVCVCVYTCQMTIVILSRKHRTFMGQHIVTIFQYA